MKPILIVLLCALLWPAAAIADKPEADTSPRARYALRLVRQTDLAARRTNDCRAGIWSSPFKIRRTYAQIESIAFRLRARHLWRERRAACAIEFARIGVPSWFRGVMLCIHPKESSDWAYNGPSGFDGGLQFLPSTWSSAGGQRFAEFAYQASPLEQIRAAFDLTGGSLGAISHHWPRSHLGCV